MADSKETRESAGLAAGSGRWRLPVSRRSAPNIVVMLLVVAMLAVAWLGYLDTYSYEYLGSSIKNTGILYGVVRGINALVSVLQSSEVSVMLVSVNIGELLDPLNDLIERFSDVVVVALGALVFQQVMLGIVSHDVFNLVMSALALMVLYSSLVKRLPLHGHLVRALLLSLFLRFALAVTVLCASLVDGWFLQQPMQQQTAVMVELESQLVNSRDALTGEAGLSHQDTEPGQRLAAARSRQQELSLALASLEQGIATAQASITRGKSTLPWYLVWYSPGWPAELAAQQQTLDDLRRERRMLLAQRSEAEDEIAQAQEALRCLELKAQGKSCGILDWFDSIKPYERYKQSLAAVSESMDRYVENIMDLIVGLLLQSVILPLLFFYAIYRGAGLLWELPIDGD